MDLHEDREENAHLEFRDGYPAAEVADWFTQQVHWALKQHGRQPADKSAE